MASLTNSIISVLGIMSTTKNSNDFSQLILKCERPFYEIFNVCMELFHRTWREMHANFDDLEKVILLL